jgi:aspartyl protease family protein
MRLTALWLAALLCGSAHAQTVSMSGRLGDKALLMIDGQPRTVGVGSTAQGVKLLSLTADSAVVEVGGKRATLHIGESQANFSGVGSAGGGNRIVLTAGSGGHFVTQGSINGKAVQFMVDTGATRVALGASDAARIGINLEKAQQGLANTANGTARVWGVKLASVRVGDVTMYDVDAMVTETDMPYVLLGNSFLTRFQMKRENDVMTLDKRY